MARHRKSDPRWRGEASAEVMAEAVAGLGLGGHVLLAGEAHSDVAEALSACGARASRWLRRAGVPGDAPAEVASGDVAARAWPHGGPFTSALLRLPRGKDELEMMLHAAAANVAAGGIIAVYGANDEGIKSVAARMEEQLGPVDTVAQRAHCRVLVARRPAVVPGLKGALADWRREGRITVGGIPSPWVSYPGTFAGGALDAGTDLLLAALAGERLQPDAKPVDLPASACVLDFACGTGTIAARIAARYPDAHIDMVDHDALAIRAAAENVPGARGIVSATLLQTVNARTATSSKYDLIVSNPPIHDGKAEDYTALGQLIARAPALLKPAGRLVLVVQSRVPADPWLEAAFSAVEMIARDTRYHVWKASAPRSGKPRNPGPAPAGRRY